MAEIQSSIWSWLKLNPLPPSVWITPQSLHGLTHTSPHSSSSSQLLPSLFPLASSHWGKMERLSRTMSSLGFFLLLVFGWTHSQKTNHTRYCVCVYVCVNESSWTQMFIKLFLISIKCRHDGLWSCVYVTINMEQEWAQIYKIISFVNLKWINNWNNGRLCLHLINTFF